MKLISGLTHPVVTMTASAALAATMLAPSVLAQQEHCPAHLIVAIPGTGETNENADPNEQTGMLSHVTGPLVSSGQAQAHYVNYPAEALNPDTGMTYAESKKTGTQRAADEIKNRIADCPDTTFSLTGYSQGADAAGDLAAAIGNGHSDIPADRIRSVALLSDPGATPGDNNLGSPGATGFAGARGGFGELADRTMSVCNDDDIYCNVPADQPALAALTQLGSSVDFSDPVAATTNIVNTLTGLDTPEATPHTDTEHTETGTIPADSIGLNTPTGAARDLNELRQADTDTATQQPGTDGNAFTHTLGSIQHAVHTGDIHSAQQQLTHLDEQLGTMSSNLHTNGEFRQHLDTLAASLDDILNALTAGDIVGVILKIGEIIPQAIEFGTHVVTNIGDIVARMPVSELAQLAATSAAIGGAAATHNYVAIPPMLGTWVGQAQNVGSKLHESGLINELPGLTGTFLGTTTTDDDDLIGQAVNFAGFLASGSHTNYATEPLDDGRTGTQTLTDHIADHI